MNEILYITILITALSSLFYKQIHTHRKLFYLLAIIIVLISTNESPNIVNTGILPFAFFIVVIMSGVLDKGDFRKHLFMVRAELAIIGSILLFPHAFGYLEYYIERFGLFNLPIFFYLGFFAYLIMLPLFFTSFQIIRRLLGYKRWKKLHRLTYLFFFLIGLHLILIQNENMPYYIALFGFYFLLKGGMILEEKFKQTRKQKQLQS